MGCDTLLLGNQFPSCRVNFELLNPEGTAFLQNIRSHSTSDTVWHPRRHEFPRQVSHLDKKLPTVTYSLWHLKVHNQPATVPSTKPDKSIHTASSHLFKTNFDINVTCMPSLLCHPVSSCFFEFLTSTLQAVTASPSLTWSPYWHIISGLHSFFTHEKTALHFQDMLHNLFYCPQNDIYFSIYLVFCSNIMFIINHTII
jgi:hypothetical protein